MDTTNENDALNQQRARNTVIVTRHPALVEWLRRSGRVATSVQVVTHATADDVRGKHVYGVLPLHLAAEAKSVTEVMLDIPAERRGQELTLDDMEKLVRGIQTYRVTKLAATRSVIPFVSAEERADMAAELLRLREAIREHCATFCQPFLPARHAPECLAHELEEP